MRFSRAFLLALLLVFLSASFITYRNPAAQATLPFVVGAHIKAKILSSAASVLVKAPSS